MANVKLEDEHHIPHIATCSVSSKCGTTAIFDIVFCSVSSIQPKACKRDILSLFYKKIKTSRQFDGTPKNLEYNNYKVKS